MLRAITKIKAFTLSEMIVVMIITSIVVAMAFSVLHLVQKHMSVIQNNFANNSEIDKLDQLLWLDFNRYSTIYKNTSEDIVVFKNEIDSVVYQFNEKFIVKNTDTIRVSLKTKSFFLNGNKATNSIIDAIKLETDSISQNQVLFVFKENDATHYMN